MNYLEWQLRQFKKYPTRHLQAYVSLLYNEAYELFEGGEYITLGSIDTFNQGRGKCYLDSVAGIEYKGKQIERDKVLVDGVECTLYQFEAVQNDRKKIQKKLASFVDRQ